MISVARSLDQLSYLGMLISIECLSPSRMSVFDSKDQYWGSVG